MANVFDEYQSSLAETMAKLGEIQSQLNIAVEGMQMQIDASKNHLDACNRDVPVMRSWIHKMLRRKEDKE